MKLFFNLFIALFIGFTATAGTEVSPYAVGTGIFSLGLLVTTPAGVLVSTIQKQIWEDFIAENLFRDFAWLRAFTKNRDKNVEMGKFVYIPQAGAKPKVIKNRAEFPIKVTNRTDTTIVYEIDQYSTEAINIPDADKIELSYDKISSVMSDHIGAIMETTVTDALSKYAPTVAANKIRTSGTAAAGNAIYSTQTGNRNALLAADILKAKNILIKTTKREKGNRIAVMSDGLYAQLVADSTLQSRDNHPALGVAFDSEGNLVKLHGFTIVRTAIDLMPYYNTSLVLKNPNADGASAATSDEGCVICWDANFAHLAKGEVKFFGNLDDATYQGDIYSALCRMGASKEYASEAGTVAIIQD